MRKLLLLSAVVLALAAGCSGSGEEAAETAATSAGSPPVAAPEVGDALDQFVRAAGNRDVEAMWALLSDASRQELGPTIETFAEEYAAGFQRGLGSFAGSGYQLVLANETESGWGIAAIAGERERSGEEEFAAYAAALANDGSGWRLELGAPLEVRVDSPPAVTDERAPPVRVVIEGEAAIEEAGVWLDGEPLPARPGGESEEVIITGEPRALSPGRHVVVVFARSGDRAVAGAFPFTVEGVEADVA